jgi:hypothetical protein
MDQHLLIDGTPTPIRLDFQALREAERIMARSVLEVLGQHGAMFKADELVALCWAAWRAKEPRLSMAVAQARVEQVIRDKGILHVQAVVAEALMDSGLLVRPEVREDPVRPQTAATATPAQPPSPS